MSTSRTARSRNPPPEEAKENDFATEPNSVPFPPPRTPLNTIADPLQKVHESDTTTRAGRASDRKLEAGAAHSATPRALTRHGKGSQSEPNSANSTPARTGSSRLSLGASSAAAAAAAAAARSAQFGRGREGSFCSSKVPRGIALTSYDCSENVAHFELEEDPLFWADHNVQVLIRIRPLNSMERVWQGQGRCLSQESAQTLTWLGHPETRFTFDHVASETISQEKLFRVAGLPMVENCMSGYNSCMFAYGQTGSGKTYTMMGEINHMEGMLGDDCGITPRIFEYLFSRIRMEEENRRDEKLKFSCKCSFLELYNEQITDLLEPSSTNLQLREDSNKGVYVENLTEYDVRTANDVIKLLLQGAANRKIAATYMNSESSRSHSVFTCVIESWWEKDSMSHFRFARLNLVDLAGSERQKSSGAEGERLKEAANINKSLSTLGLVIMSLVDLAHGKHRHVPYRDSRLTFLLQDSLGGNSKTTIIANVSPSICSAHETLSTLKFAQRAKLIQNNAKVNEDATGDVRALQRQIQQLKDQLSFLMKRYSLTWPLTTCTSKLDGSRLVDCSESGYLEEESAAHERKIPCVETKKVEHAETTFVDSPRRDKTAEVALRKLDAEIRHVNQYACQMEEDVQRTKMMLRLREDKIKHLELMMNGSLPLDHYLIEENKALKLEIQLLQAKIDKNPELARLALENSRLLEQLQLFQNFYEQGEREKLLAEISELRDQGDDNTVDLEDLRELNSKLLSEIDELRRESTVCSSCGQDAFNCEESRMHMKMLRIKKKAEKRSIKLESICLELQNLKGQSSAFEMDYKDTGSQALQAKLDKLTDDLEEANLLNCQYQKDRESQLSQQHQVEVVREQVETETARTILQLQEEVTALQLEFDDRICSMTQENSRLQKMLAAKEKETRKLSEKWESATLELTNFLLEGSKSLKDAYGQIGSIVSLFPEVNISISEQVERAARGCLEKEETMLQLEASLQDAQRNVVEMELKLNSLREATLALNEFRRLDEDESAEDNVQLNSLLNEKINTIRMMERKLELKEDLINKAEKRADAAFLVVKWLSNCHKTGNNDDAEKAIRILKMPSPTNICNCQRSEIKTDLAALTVEEANGDIQFENLYFESEKSIKTFCIDMEVLISGIHMEIHQASSAYMNSVQEMVKEIREIRSRYIDIKEKHMGSQSFVKLKALETVKSLKFDNQLLDLSPIRDELAKMTERLDLINDFINGRKRTHGCLVNDENLVEADGWSADYSISNCSTMGFDCPSGSVVSVVESESEDSTKELKVSHQDEAMKLIKEVDMVFDSFSNIYFPLIKILGENTTVACSRFEEMFPSFGLRMEIAAGSCSDTQKVVAAKNINPATTFLSKFEEAQAAMTEADYMLNALLKANENAKQLNGMWKQANEQLMEERSRLLEENELLRSSIYLKERENKLLLDETSHCLLELVNSVSLLEGCFVQMQREVEDTHKKLYSDFLSVGGEMLNFILSSRSSLESTYFEILEKGFSLYVLYQCLTRVVGHKLPSLAFRHKECDIVMNNMPNNSSGDRLMFRSIGGMERVEQSDHASNLVDGELVSLLNNLKCENMSLKRELERKENLLKGLLFDLSLLQETASSKKDIKDETENLILALNEVRQQLDMKTSQLDDILVKYRNLENHQMDTENALLMSISDLEQAKETIDTLADQNAELKMLLKDLYIGKSEAEEALAEQKEVVKSLEKEIIHLNTSSERKLRSSIDGLEEDLHELTNERDQLREEICSLTDKLEMAYAIADENEAVAIEARQESESSKIYAEQKEEEVKILEHSVEELEHTINVLEKKVCEMDEEMKRHQLIRDSLELELQALRQRLSTVENFTDTMDPDGINATQNEYHLSRQLRCRLLELNGSHNQIRLLEKDIQEKDKEIKQLKEYVSELVLHSEAQAAKYQEKYKTLEAMVHEVNTNSACTVPVSDRTERSSIRPRGSSSPFRCIAGLVQQMSLDNEKELSGARLRIDELEALLASRQKEICMLNARLAAAESMTHDVIRDLLGVKLDMTNYANLIDQHQVQKIVEEAQQQTEEFRAKEQEIFNLRKQIDDLTEERERCDSEMNRKAADMLVAQMTLEQLQERDQLLAAQNEMLKVDKSNLLKRVAELDEIVKTLLGSQSSYKQIQRRTSNTKETSSLRFSDGGLAKRPQYSEKLVSRVDELATYRKPGPGHPHA